VKPPFTLPLIMPLTVSPSSKACSSLSQAAKRFAFSRESRVVPKPSSTASRATSTSSPTATSSSPSGEMNWLRGMIPSVFRPALTMTMSGVISTTSPVMTVPGWSWVLVRLSSKSSAKLSVIGLGFSGPGGRLDPLWDALRGQRCDDSAAGAAAGAVRHRARCPASSCANALVNDTPAAYAACSSLRRKAPPGCRLTPMDHTLCGQ